MIKKTKIPINITENNPLISLYLTLSFFLLHDDTQTCHHYKTTFGHKATNQQILFGLPKKLRLLSMVLT